MQDYAVLRQNANAIVANSMPESADWMLLSALRDSENHVIDYLGEPHTIRDRLAGITLPVTLTSWLEATNAYSSVSNRTTLLSDSEASLLQLIPAPNVDIALLVNSGIIAFFPSPVGAPNPADLIQVQDHYVLMTEPATIGGNPAWMRIGLWTWGRVESGWVGHDHFLKKYFGPIVAVA